MMKRFKNHRRRRLRRKIEQTTLRIQALSEQLLRYEPDTPEFDRLAEARVALWWKRNALYKKLKEAL